MRALRISIGLALILAGMAFGVFVTLHYVVDGIFYIQNGELRRGLLILLVWSELIGIAVALAFLVPGALILRNIDRERSKQMGRS